MWACLCIGMCILVRVRFAVHFMPTVCKMSAKSSRTLHGRLPPNQVLKGFRENQWILFSIKENQGKMRGFLENRGKPGNFLVSNCFISERWLSPYLAMHPVERNCSQVLPFRIFFCSIHSF